MSLGRGILMGKVTRCKHSWSRSWWETVASQGQLWSQLYRFELEEKLRSKTLEQECHRRVNISHKFHGCFVWSLFECSCFHGARLSHLLLQPCNVSRFLPCVRGYLEKQLCTGDVCEFHFFANHLIHSLPWYAPRNRAEKCTKGYLRWQLWSRDICPTLFVEKLTSTMRSICLLYCVLFQWDVESIMDNS